MKILKKVLLYFIYAFTGIVSLPFIFVEFRNFFSFEFVYMNNAALNGIAYLARAIYFLLILALAVFTILFIASKRKFCIILFATSLALFSGALLSLIFFEYYVSLVLIAITLLQLVPITVGSLADPSLESTIYFLLVK